MGNFAVEFHAFTGVSLNEIPLYAISIAMIAFSIYLWKNEK